MRDSIIFKKMTFRIFSTNFTLIFEALAKTDDFSDYANLVLANLLTSGLLNYGMVS